MEGTGGKVACSWGSVARRVRSWNWKKARTAAPEAPFLRADAAGSPTRGGLLRAPVRQISISAHACAFLRQNGGEPRLRLFLAVLAAARFSSGGPRLGWRRASRSPGRAASSRRAADGRARTRAKGTPSARRERGRMGPRAARGAGGVDPRRARLERGRRPWEGPLESLAGSIVGDVARGVEVDADPGSDAGVHQCPGDGGERREVRVGSPASGRRRSGTLSGLRSARGTRRRCSGTTGGYGCADPQSDDPAAFLVMAGDWHARPRRRRRVARQRCTSGLGPAGRTTGRSIGVIDVNVFIAPGSGQAPQAMSQVLVNLFPYGARPRSVGYFALPPLVRRHQQLVAE